MKRLEKREEVDGLEEGEGIFEIDSGLLDKAEGGRTEGLRRKSNPKAK